MPQVLPFSSTPVPILRLVNNPGSTLRRCGDGAELRAVRAHLAEGFYLVNAIEKYGSGFIRIRRALQDYPEVQFDIEEKFGGVMATFSRTQPESPREGASGGVTGGVNGGVIGGVGGGVNVEASHLLQLIQSRPGLKTAELVIQTGKPRRTIERWLKQLKDSQRIEFRGAPKTGGYHPKDQ